MYGSIRIDGDSPLMDDGAYLRRHDVVYRTPAYKGYEALPVGNGDLAAMLFNSPRSVEIVLNKSDALDLGPDGAFKAWAWESEERNSCQVSCASISITDGMPSFDRNYLEEFEARLDISSALVSMSSRTPFSSWKSSIYVSERGKVLVARVGISSAEEIAPRISLERWGTRNFFHFYEQYVADPSIRLGDAASGAAGGRIWVRQDYPRTSVLAFAAVLGAEARIELPNSHSAEFVLPKAKYSEFVLLVTALADNGGDRARARGADGAGCLAAEASRIIDDAIRDLDLLPEEHSRSWRLFWGKSFVSVEDEYVENLYCLHLYSLISCSRGRYPVNFAGGAWTWNGDRRNWGHFYHWNAQQSYWCVYAANHPELAANYLEYRYGMLESAKRDAKEQYGVEGAYFSDISNLNGFQAIEPDTVRNLSVGAQIAMDFYRSFEYSGDLSFLETRALPMMEACADFYLGLLFDEGGEYHLRGGATAYESYWVLRDTITDYSMVKVLFAALLEARRILGVEKGNEAEIEEVLSGLFVIPTTDIQRDGAGTVPVLAAGIKWDGTPVSIAEGEYPLSPFPASQFSAVFPSGLIGLKDEGTELFRLAQNTARTIFDDDVYRKGKMGCSGHTPAPEVAARLGMAEDAERLLALFAERHQVFPNGFFHYLDRDSLDSRTRFHPRILKGSEDSTEWKSLHEKGKGERIAMDPEDFLHMYCEPSSNLAAGLLESLLQSHDGTIRVFPAVPLGRAAAFRLLAKGGFLVSSEKGPAGPSYVRIESTIGGECSIALPWSPNETGARLGRGESFAWRAEGNIARFGTSPGDSILFFPKASPPESLYREGFRSGRNEGPKRKGKATIGKERDF